VINHKHRFIFIHIPKNAGTSIEFAFSESRDHNTIQYYEFLYNWHRFLFKPKKWPHSARFIVRILRCSKKSCLPLPYYYANYTKFSVVRNPYDRAVSWFRNVQRHEFHQLQLGVSGDIGFKEFLLTAAGKGLGAPQCDFIKDSYGSIAIDEILRFEELETDFRKFAAKHSLKGLTLPHKLKADSVNYLDFYDDECVDIVNKIYSEDFQLFGYKKI